MVTKILFKCVSPLSSFGRKKPIDHQDQYLRYAVVSDPENIGI